jgi:hypothetical protein
MHGQSPLDIGLFDAHRSNHCERLRAARASLSQHIALRSVPDIDLNCENAAPSGRFMVMSNIEHRILAGLAHVPAKWDPVRRQGHAPIRDLRRFQVISDDRVIQYHLEGL